MDKQIIVSISREFGTGGHEIGKRIAKDLGIQFYDRSMLDEIANELNVKVEVLKKYDQKPRNLFLSRRVGDHTNSMEEILAEIQFDYIRKKAENGESFAIVGRCGETVLEDYDGLISVFICGNQQQKLERVMDKFSLSEADALAKMKRHDYKRRRYHNRHSDGRWGDSRNYNVCINSSQLGIERTIRILENYIRERQEAKEE